MAIIPARIVDFFGTLQTFTGDGGCETRRYLAGICRQLCGLLNGRRGLAVGGVDPKSPAFSCILLLSSSGRNLLGRFPVTARITGGKERLGYIFGTSGFPVVVLVRSVTAGGRRMKASKWPACCCFHHLLFRPQFCGWIPAMEGFDGGGSTLGLEEQCKGFVVVVSFWPWMAGVGRKIRRKTTLKAAKQRANSFLPRHGLGLGLLSGGGVPRQIQWIIGERRGAFVLHIGVLGRAPARLLLPSSRRGASSSFTSSTSRASPSLVRVFSEAEKGYI